MIFLDEAAEVVVAEIISRCSVFHQKAAFSFPRLASRQDRPLKPLTLRDNAA